LGENECSDDVDDDDGERPGSEFVNRILCKKFFPLGLLRLPNEGTFVCIQLVQSPNCNIHYTFRKDLDMKKTSGRERVSSHAAKPYVCSLHSTGFGLLS
jgi:hypothetical protein